MNSTWAFEFEDDCLKDLEECLQQGPITVFQGKKLRPLNEELVATIGGLKVYIYANEHPPPHFHIKYNGEENSFSLSNGEPLYPNNGLKQFFRNINKWYSKNRVRMIKSWNDNRPTDCPVGKIECC